MRSFSDSAARKEEASEPREVAGPALRTFFRIAAAWGLTAEEQMVLLGSPSRSTFFGWKKHGVERLPRDVLERLSYVFGIWKALQILLPVARTADEWIRRPNAAFGGGTALERMLSGNVSDLYEVRQYLDGERGGWP
jgi:hypothetical protein